MIETSTQDIGFERAVENRVKRCIVMKKPSFDPLAQDYLRVFCDFLEISGVEEVRTGVRYDIEGIDGSTFEQAKRAVLSEASVNDLHSQEDFYDAPEWQDWHEIRIETLPGQYDQRADSAMQCLQLLTSGDRAPVKVANIIMVKGKLNADDITKIKQTLINDQESREAKPTIPETLYDVFDNPGDVKILGNFLEQSLDDLAWLFLPVKKGGLGLAMSKADLLCVQNYFKAKDRDPTVAEVRIIDTYWSDHCRHLTFTTELVEIAIDGKRIIEKGVLVSDGQEFAHNPDANVIYQQLSSFVRNRSEAEKEGRKGFSLMDMALSASKKLRAFGLLKDVEHSKENNAASIIVPVEFEDGHTEEWLFMFKNETHNHPTQIEPFGGAATCVGGVIRDPLSGRAYVFMGIRITGSGDPRKALSETRAGRLPSRYITQKAAAGYSSYGNQIGVPTLQVREYYDEGDTSGGTYEAKRFEAGCVGGAVRRDQVVREDPKPGDIVILVGGRTGRDGIGGATGSSKSHDAVSNATCGAEVQKGNAVEERKIQRLFKKPIVSKLIKKCNDFGAGGVANAIGELADGISIDLDKVPLKYQGLDGTEIALSESQERMAVVVAAEDVSAFIVAAAEENLEANVVAEIKEERSLRLSWRGQSICDIDRDFLEKGWAPREAKADMQLPDPSESIFDSISNLNISEGDTLEDVWKRNLERINVCSQRGLQQRFDSTVGANTVVSPFGGEFQLSPSECAIAKFPVEGAVTGMSMSAGFNPQLSIKSPFHNGVYAVVESLARLVASGADHKKARLSFQNYFERLGDDPKRWGKAVLAHTGALLAQNQLVPSIGGKDSASGSYGAGENRIDVPFGLVSFAVASVDMRKVVPSCFQKSNSKIMYIAHFGGNDLPDWDELERNFVNVHEIIQSGKVLSCRSVHDGGLAAALSKMSFGNKIGLQIENPFIGKEVWFSLAYGGFILEMAEDAVVEENQNTYYLGKTDSTPSIQIWTGSKPSTMSLDDLITTWEKPLDDIFPLRPHVEGSSEPVVRDNHTKMARRKSGSTSAKPKAVIPVFPGTNCEYETAAAFESEGAETTTPVFRNLTAEAINESITQLVKEIRSSQILVFAGGFSAGDEPDGSGKFIANVLRQPQVAESIEEFLRKDGLVLGICNGFQALIKSGLLPYGKIGIPSPDDPTLTHNTIGHYLSFEARHKVKSVLSPWLAEFEIEELIDMPIAHGEGKFVAPRDVIEQLWQNGQIPLQYVNRDGDASMSFPANPNGSMDAIAALTNRKANILGLMAHPERSRSDLSRNIPGIKNGYKFFRAGVQYFK